MKNNQSEIEFEHDMLKSREETLKAELEALAEEKQSEEVLKVIIDALEKENSALRKQSNVKPLSLSLLPNITSPWEPAPINSLTAIGSCDSQLLTSFVRAWYIHKFLSTVNV